MSFSRSLNVILKNFLKDSGSGFLRTDRLLHIFIRLVVMQQEFQRSLRELIEKFEFRSSE